MSKYKAKWIRLARRWEKGNLLIRIKCKGKKVWERKGPANQVIAEFSLFLGKHPEYLNWEDEDWEETSSGVWIRGLPK